MKQKTLAVLISAFFAGCGGGGGSESLVPESLAQPVCEAKQPANTFATTGYRSLSTTAWGYSKVSSPVRLGRESQRFEVRAGDCASDPGWSDCANDRERSEITVDQKIYSNQTRAISWSFYLGPDFQDSANVKTTLGQIYSWHENKPAPIRGPVLQFELWGGQYQMCWHRITGTVAAPSERCQYYPLTTLAQMKGRWTDVIVEINTSKTTGYAKVWLNGQLLVDIKEPVIFTEADYHFVKYGLYRSFVSRHGSPLPTQIAFFDEIRVAEKVSQVDLRCDLKATD